MKGSFFVFFLRQFFYITVNVSAWSWGKQKTLRMYSVDVLDVLSGLKWHHYDGVQHGWLLFINNTWKLNTYLFIWGFYFIFYSCFSRSQGRGGLLELIPAVRVQRQGYIPDIHQFITGDFVGGAPYIKNAEVCICFSFFCYDRSLWILQLGCLILNQSAIPRSKCRVFSVLIRCQECTPERTPGIQLLLNMRSSDFIVFGRLGQTKRQPCLSI